MNSLLSNFNLSLQLFAVIYLTHEFIASIAANVMNFHVVFAGIMAILIGGFIIDNIENRIVGLMVTASKRI